MIAVGASFMGYLLQLRYRAGSFSRSQGTCPGTNSGWVLSMRAEGEAARRQVICGYGSATLACTTASEWRRDHYDVDDKRHFTLPPSPRVPESAIGPTQYSCPKVQLPCPSLRQILIPSPAFGQGFACR